jgi:hypothetical protein
MSKSISSIGTATSLSNGFGVDLSKCFKIGKPKPLIMPFFALQIALR